MSDTEPRRCVDYEEQGAHTGWRQVLFWQSGELAKVKRRTNRRERRERRLDAERRVREEGR